MRFKGDHDKTGESKKAKQLENKLLIEYNAILTQIKKKVNFSVVDYKNQLNDLKISLKPMVYDITRTYYQLAYELGSLYVNNALGTTSYLTHSDITHIESQSENFTERFFGRIENLLNKTGQEAIQSLVDVGTFNSILSNDNQMALFAKRIESTRSYLFSSLAILVITDGVNSATIRKARTLKESLTSSLGLSPTLLTGAGVNIIHKEEYAAMDLELVRLLMIINTLRLRWYTSRDDRVCARCRNLEGKSWTLSLSVAIGDIPQIPDNTHLNCRCRMFIESDMPFA